MISSSEHEVAAPRNNSTLDQKEKWRIIKNVVVLGFSFMLQFTAYFGMSNLQSSINSDASLGYYSLATVYIALIASNIFLPVVLIRYIGCKWTVAVSLITYMPYIAAQMYPTFGTLIPAALLVGLGGGPLWCAKCTYLSKVAEVYAKISGELHETVLLRFFSIFFTILTFCGIWGNLISSTILSFSDGDKTEDMKVDFEAVCGGNYCPGATTFEENENLKPPGKGEINLIVFIFLGCMAAAAMLITFFLDSLNRYNNDGPDKAAISGVSLLTQTMKQMFNPYQLLLTPITIFAGLQITFLGSDFAVSFVTCGWGVSHIGYVLLFNGVSNIFANIIIGFLVKYTGHGPLIAFGTSVLLGVFITLNLWVPQPGQYYVYYLIAIACGFGESSISIPVNALGGIAFRGNEASSFSLFRLWESVGACTGYILSAYVCVSVKMTILMSVLFCGILGYTMFMFFVSRHQNSEMKKEIDATKQNIETISMHVKEATFDTAL